MFFENSKIQVRRHRESAPWTYASLDLHQRQIATDVENGLPGKILLSEVAPVITLGKRAILERELTDSPLALVQRGTSIFPTDRGGFATYHGPGQWVLFWVEKLEVLTGDSRGVRKWVNALMRASQKTLENFGVEAFVGEGAHFGVWSPRGKIVSCGIAVKNGVVLHGISLNGFKQPLSFQGLRPCALETTPAGEPMVMDYVLPSPERFDELGEQLLNQIQIESQELRVDRALKPDYTQSLNHSVL